MSTKISTVTRFGLPALAAVSAFTPDVALAAAQNLPWEAPLEQIVDSLSGPVVTSVSIASIVVAGLTYAFSEGGGMMRRTSGMVVGLSIAALSATLVTELFGVSQGFAF